MPSVEIVEDGKSISQERIDPNVASFIFQAVQASQLVKLRKLEESKIPIGASSFEWTITTTTKRVDLANPWISFTLYNEGLGSVKVRINTLNGDMSDETTVNSGEVLNRDFEYPIITRLYLVTESSTAIVRVHAEEGKKWE